MAKKVVGKIGLALPAGKATPAPPVGPALGPYSLNIMISASSTTIVLRLERAETLTVLLHDATSTPIERAVPAMIFTAWSMSFALRSGIFVCAISLICACVSLPTLLKR